MLATLEIVLPVFAVIGCGWLFGRRKLITDAGLAGITNVVFYLAIPALLFRTMASGAVQKQIDPAILGAYFGAAFLQFAAGWLVSRLVFRNGVTESALAGMAATFSNLVLIGLPLVQRAYGEAALVPLMLIVTVHSAILFSLTTLALALGRGRGEAASRLGAVAGGLRAVFLNPIVLGALGGLAFGFLGVRLPGVIDEVLALLGRGASPLSLIAVGASMAGFRIAGDLREAVAMTALKLLLLPGLVWAACTWLVSLPAGWATVAVVAAAMPAGANVYVFARKHEVYTARATAVVMLSTALSVITVTALMVVLPPP